MYKFSNYTSRINKNMIVLDFLFLLITGLLSLYPVSKLVKYRDKRKCLLS
jgi:hypothetical protein